MCFVISVLSPARSSNSNCVVLAHASPQQRERGIFRPRERKTDKAHSTSSLSPHPSLIPSQLISLTFLKKTWVTFFPWEFTALDFAGEKKVARFRGIWPGKDVIWRKGTTGGITLFFPADHLLLSVRTLRVKGRHWGHDICSGTMHTILPTAFLNGFFARPKKAKINPSLFDGQKSGKNLFKVRCPCSLDPLSSTQMPWNAFFFPYPRYIWHRDEIWPTPTLGPQKAKDVCVNTQCVEGEA